MEKEFIKKLEQQHDTKFESVSDFSLKTRVDILTEIVEKEFTSTASKEEKKLLEEQIYDFYIYQGLKTEVIEEYLSCLERNDTEGKKKISVNAGEEFEEAEMFYIAAKHYFRAEQYEKAYNLLIQVGLLGSNRGIELLYARDCLTAMGVEWKDANLQIAEEYRKMLEKDWEYKTPCIYSYLAECLHNAGKTEETLEVLMTPLENESYDHRLRVGRDYLESIGDYKRAVEFQKKILSAGYGFYRDEYRRLAKYYNMLGKKREEAEALWRGREYLKAAEITSETTGTKEPYIKAGEAYSKIRPEKHKAFSKLVWEYFKKKTYEIYDQDTEFHYSSRHLTRYDSEKTLKKFDKLFSFLYSAFSLPKPKKIPFAFTNNTSEHKGKAETLYQDFLRKKELTKKNKMREIFSDSTLLLSLKHSILGGSNQFDLIENVEKAFKGIPAEVPEPNDSNKKVKELWEKAMEEERWTISFNPTEMATYSYEKGANYSEAKKRYLRLKRFDDVKRMDELMKNQKT